MPVTVTTGQPYYVRGTNGFFKGELTDLDGKASVAYGQMNAGAS